MDSFFRIISEICHEEGIELSVLSFGWIYELRKNGEIRHIVGRNFDLNTETGSIIAGDKYACYEVLKNNGIPAAEHMMLFNPLQRAALIDENGIWTKAVDYFNANQGKIVVKPNRGWQGRNVFLCESLKDLEAAIQLIFQDEPNLCLCPFYSIENEYRIFYAGGSCLFVYGKENAYVEGDGKRALSQMIKKLNLTEENIRCDHEAGYIPRPGEKVRVSWKHNLSKGAQAFQNVEPPLLDSLYELAEKAARVIHVNCATIDIIRLPGHELKVLEINTGVATKKFLEQYPDQYNYNIIKNIYLEIIRKMFTC